MDEKELYFRCSAYCATAERCISEVTEKLKKWEADPEVSRQIIQKLVRENYLDEARYSEAFVRDKYRFAKWGKRKISQALYQKRIPELLIREALEKIDPDEYLDILKGLLKQKEKSVKGKTEWEKKSKLIRFAVGRGFDMSDIRKCIGCEEESDYLD
ncbi:MAG: RecX family transcriptional regulator [Bacteroides sp.]|nr:RecX family transcriptional regulator [Bacteroides sp.]